MYSLDESSNDLDRYMKIIESEARELRECNPLSGTRPNFNQNRRNVANVSSYNSRSTDNSGDNYSRQSNGYSGGNYSNKSDHGNSNGYGGNSGGYGASSSGFGNSSGSNHYGGSNGGSNSYGGGSSYRNQASSSHGGDSQDWGSSNFSGTSNNNAGPSNQATSGSTDWTSKDAGYGGSNYGNSGRSNYGSSGPANSYGSSGGNNYGSNSNSHSNANNAGGSSDDWGSANFGGPNINGNKGYTESNNSNSYGNAQSSNYGISSQSQDKPGSSTTADTYSQNGGSRSYSTGPPVQEDVDGYQRLDFNRCLISYNEPGNLNIKHVFLNILNRSDLMEYTTKIMEASCQDKIVLAIQRDNQLAESYAYQLRQRGFWSFEVTNKTKDPEKLLKQHSIYRCAVTTMSYLRDNVDQFQFPSLIINFDHVISHVKFLERFLTYRNPASAIEQKECYIYELCFNHSTTSQNLKEYIQNQQK